MEDRVFVGRTVELGALRAGLDRACSGRGGVFLLAGEPGIGKSELADRLGHEALAKGAEVLWGRSWEGEGAPPYWPWAQILRTFAAERKEVEPVAIFGAAAPYVGQIVSELRDRLPALHRYRFAHALIRREGEFWTITFDGRTVRLRDSVGLRYLASLLARPGNEMLAASHRAHSTGRRGARPPERERGGSPRAPPDHVRASTARRPSEPQRPPGQFLPLRPRPARACELGSLP